MSCAQIEVTGGGDATPDTVSFPGAYTGEEYIHKLHYASAYMCDQKLIPVL